MILLNFYLWSFVWHPDPFLFENDFFSLRWYSSLFVLGFIVGRYIVVRSYRLENGYDLTVDMQMLYMVAGTLIGSRMGHVIFYEPEILKTNFFKLFYFWESGLASHGAAIGILLGMAIYSYQIKISGFSIKFIDRRRRNYNYYQVMDRMVIAIALGCAFIRIGNFFNSEIIGKPTESNYGVVFTQPIEKKIKSQLPFVRNVNFTTSGKNYELGKPILQTSIVFENNLYMEDRIRKSVEKRLKYILPNKISSYTNVINPYQGSLNYSFHRTEDQFELRFKSVGVNRHPAQIYEASNYFILGVLLFLIWNKHRSRLRPGSLLGLFFLIAFSSRFIIEGFKENQVNFESYLYLNMGQLLSVPMFLLGFYFFFSSKKLGAAFRLYN